eukprot:SAG25_NODE_28_length_20925_cov_13.342839_15_plen_74_part_00
MWQVSKGLQHIKEGKRCFNQGDIAAAMEHFDIVNVVSPYTQRPHFQQNLRALKLSVNWPDAENELELEPELEA